MQWDSRFANRTNHMRRSAVREILKLTAQPDMISFAGGLPAPDFFPVERIKEATDTVLSEHGQAVLQYSTTEGMPSLRRLIADRISGGGVKVSPDNILIVSGSQQALDLIARVMFDKKDRLVVENPTYIGMLSAWRPYQLDYMPVPTDEHGIRVDEMRPILEKNPKAIYTIPNFQNPQGVTMSLERRQQLVKLLAEYHIPVIEDDPYGEICFDETPPPSLMRLDALNLGLDRIDGHVMYAGTFSKVLTPGLRVGWIVAPDDVMEKLIQAKQGSDLHTSTLNQFIVYETARDGFLDEHINTLRQVYRERRGLMLSTMDEHFPSEVRWTRPDGGLFLMVWLPDHMDATELLKIAIENHKVAYVPGGEFHTGGDGLNSFRLNYSNARPERIVEGIKRLATLFKENI